MSSAFILTRAERNTIVAALTFYQRHIDTGRGLPDDVARIACGGDEEDVDPIVADELQSLIDGMKGAVDIDGVGRDIGIELAKVLHGARQIEQSLRHVLEAVPEIIEEDGDDDVEIIVEGVGLHPANTASMDMRTRELMLEQVAWPQRNMLPLRRRTNKMAFGYIKEPVEGPQRRLVISVQNGDQDDEVFDTIDDALRAGWTAD